MSSWVGLIEAASVALERYRQLMRIQSIDPLMATLMKNPVILPVSRVTVDQATIRAVLLSNNKDPFNNVP